MPITMYLPHTVDLLKPMKKILLTSAFLTGDNLAHCFHVDIFSGGVPHAVDGASVTGYFIRPDGATVTITGKADGARVSLTLPESCYHVQGRFSLVIRLNLDGVKTTVFWAEGAISLSSTDTLVDDGTIPSLDDLMAKIAAMEAGTQAATQAASTIMTKLERGELTGKGLQILGYYPTSSALTAAVKTPAPGDAYAVGTAAPYNTYIWDAVSSAWINNGPLQGVQGERGPNGTAAQHNLLHNSSFTRPINQRGKTSYTGAGYSIDRWCTHDNSTTVQIAAGGVKVTGTILQYVESADPSKVYTMAVCDTAGKVYLVTGIPANSPYGSKCFLGVGSNGYVSAGIYGGTWAWAALYEGEYTPETLPDYISKGFAAEMTECRRYYYALTQADCTLLGTVLSSSLIRFMLPLSIPMRAMPTATLGGITWLRHSGMNTAPSNVVVSSLYLRPGQIEMNISVTADGLSSYQNCSAGLSGELSFTADL